MSGQAPAARRSADLGHAFGMLEALFAQGGRPRELADLAAQAQVPLRTARRVARSLLDHGIVALIGGGYGLGPAALRLAASMRAHTPVAAIAQPVLGALAAALNETATLNIHYPREAKVVCVAVCECDRSFQFALHQGEVHPLDAGAYGRAVLAFMKQAGGPRGELAAIRKRGVAVSLTADATEIAAPVFEASGVVIGSLAVTIPAGRASPALRAKAVEAVRQRAAELSVLLGAAPSARKGMN